MPYTTDFRASGKRYRRTFTTKGEATRFEAYIRTKAATGDWNPRAKDTRCLSELVDLWQELHGHTISQKRSRHLKKITTALSDPIAAQLTPSLWLQYQSQRLQKGTSKKTINNELGYNKSGVQAPL